MLRTDLWLYIAIGTLLVGCDKSDSSEPGPQGQFPAFALGVEYMEQGLASAFTPTGVRWAKTRLEAFQWGAIEPNAPLAGVHTYDWACTDEAVRSYQQAGMVSIQSYLGSKSPWGSKAFLADHMPRPEYVADYQAWVRALIERYDGDGMDDMPGLVAPIRYWVVGAEWTGFWPSGSAQDYIELLDLTQATARSAYADVVLGTIPFMLYDVFEGNEPSQAEIDARLANPSPGGRLPAAGIYEILDRPELFDYVCVHSLGDYTELPPTLRWFREQMMLRGYQKPIWLDDAFPMSLLANVAWPVAYPLQVEAERLPVLTALRAVALLAEPAYSESKTWVTRLTARGTVQKVITALGEGAVGIQLGNTEDWMHDSNTALRQLQVNLIGAAAMMGFVEVSHPGNLYDYCSPRTPGNPRPAFHNLSLLTERIQGVAFDQIDKFAGTGGIRGYTFHRGGEWWSCVWLEDDQLQLPGDPEVPIQMTIPVPSGASQVRAVWAVTEGSTPPEMVLPVQNLLVSLPLTSTPVFLARL